VKQKTRNSKLFFVLLMIFLVIPLQAAAKAPPKGEVIFNFVDVDLPVITKFVSEITRKNFILDERVKGKITIISPAKLSVSDTFDLFTAILEMKGFTVVPSGVDAYSIIPASEARQKGLKFLKDHQPVNAAYMARLIPLKVITASDALKFIQPLVSRDGHASAFGPGNLLLVIDSGFNIENIVSVIKNIDKPSDTRGVINILFLEHADATDMAKVLDGLIKGAQSQAQRQPSTMPAFEAIGGISITADKASNALIIVAHPTDYQNLTQIIKKLDQRRRQVFVEATIAEVSIDKLLELGTKWRAAALSGGQPVIIGGVGKVDSATVSTILNGMAGLTMGGMGNYFTIPQTFIQGATSDIRVPGLVALFSLSDFKNAVNVLSSPQILTSDNKEAEIIVGENVPILSKRERDITTTNTVLSSIDRKDVGINLKITPQINEGDYLKLDIYQEISAVVGGQSENIITTVGPTFTKRSTRTSVVVKDKQTVVIGGLMSERDEETLTKMPFFGDIPIIGWLFKYKSMHKVKTNLLVFLTPNIVKESGHLEKISVGKLSEFMAREKIYVEDEVILHFKSGVSSEKAEAIIREQKATVIKILKNLVYHIKLKQTQNVEDAEKIFAALPEVQKVEPINRITLPVK
jgi:type II secretory pathway component GspD/PulD (secretin)